MVRREHIFVVENIKLITDFLDISVDKYPNKTGFVDENGSNTFSEFRDKAYLVASEIINKKLEKSPIAIYLSKSIDSLITALGVVYSNCFYTFLDDEMPMSRVKSITNVLEPKLIITDEKHVDKIRELNIPFATLEEIYNGFTNIEGIFLCKRKAIDTDIVYVLFTSGSTGVPKGVVVSHINIITYMKWSKEAFGFDETTIFGNQTPFYFSMSVLDIFQTLYCSAELVIIPKKLFSFPVELLEYLNQKRINTIYWVPSALCHVANMGALELKKSNELRTILFAGEVMPSKQLNIWRKYIPNASYANLFGPTEVTDICTYYILNRPLMDNESVPIGYSCDNMNIMVIDEFGKPANRNQIGEMYVRGSSVAYGYYNNPSKTSERFVQNPLNDKYPEIVYKTGDLVYFNDKNELIYVSRNDFQIKHMGYRIELGEIETNVSSLDGISRNCCLYDFDKSMIVLFYTGDLDESILRKKIKGLLPKYMIPNRCIKLENMPLNLNGKIDKLFLQKYLKGDDKYE